MPGHVTKNAHMPCAFVLMSCKGLFSCWFGNDSG